MNQNNSGEILIRFPQTEELIKYCEPVRFLQDTKLIFSQCQFVSDS